MVKEAQTYAEDTGLLFMETSAKTAMNVNELFLAIGEWPLSYIGSCVSEEKGDLSDLIKNPSDFNIQILLL